MRTVVIAQTFHSPRGKWCDCAGAHLHVSFPFGYGVISVSVPPQCGRVWTRLSEVSIVFANGHWEELCFPKFLFAFGGGISWM